MNNLPALGNLLFALQELTMGLLSARSLLLRRVQAGFALAISMACTCVWSYLFLWVVREDTVCRRDIRRSWFWVVVGLDSSVPYLIMWLASLRM